MVKRWRWGLFRFLLPSQTVPASAVRVYLVSRLQLRHQLRQWLHSFWMPAGAVCEPILEVFADSARWPCRGASPASHPHLILLRQC